MASSKTGPKPKPTVADLCAREVFDLLSMHAVISDPEDTTPREWHAVSPTVRALCLAVTVMVARR